MLLISYDLNKTGQDYEKIIDAIKALGTWAHPMKSLWLIKGRKDNEAVFLQLKKMVDDNDYLAVVAFDKSNLSGWLSTEVVEWLAK